MRSLFLCVPPTMPAACSSYPAIQTVGAVDLQRFMAEWYVIANIPAFIEAEAFNAVKYYRLTEKGTVVTPFNFSDERFRGRTEDLPSGRLYHRQAIDCRLGCSPSASFGQTRRKN